MAWEYMKLYKCQYTIYGLVLLSSAVLPMVYDNNLLFYSLSVLSILLGIILLAISFVKLNSGTKILNDESRRKEYLTIHVLIILIICIGFTIYYLYGWRSSVRVWIFFLAIEIIGMLLDRIIKRKK